MGWPLLARGWAWAIRACEWLALGGCRVRRRTIAAVVCSWRSLGGAVGNGREVVDLQKGSHEPRDNNEGRDARRLCQKRFDCLPGKWKQWCGVVLQRSVKKGHNSPESQPSQNLLNRVRVPSCDGSGYMAPSRRTHSFSKAHIDTLCMKRVYSFSAPAARETQMEALSFFNSAPSKKFVQALLVWYSSLSVAHEPGCVRDAL